jgi:hypothetical protein
LIIGSAGGNEILTSIFYRAPHIEAVELNPVTVDLLTGRYAAYTGHLADRPDVDLHRGDGRTYLAKSDRSYDLVWYVAPDSYSATNAASSGAFVLSESYLYTTQMIEETLRHLTPDGVMVVQFGELDFAGSPNRTSRYVVTARHALERVGVPDPSQHFLIASHHEVGDLETIVVKRTPFTDAEISAFTSGVSRLPRDEVVYTPRGPSADHVVADLAGGSDDAVDRIVARSTSDISVVTDNKPFFWHFSRFDDVIRHILDPISVKDPEAVVGERVLLLLLAVSATFAAVFLLLPFALVRRQWRALPAKGVSAIYFAALGLGFMFYEITMIQRLTRFLGYPTYSLTVTLASILVFTGLGSLLSNRFAGRERASMPYLVALLGGLTVFYQFGLDAITDALQGRGLGVRVVVALLVLAPLGFALGMFMPFGLRRVAALTDHGDQYVAWAWAVNGFFSVIGSVLTTILSMSFGFRAVQYGALALYVAAGLTFLRLCSASRVAVADGGVDLDVTARAPATIATAASTASDGSAAARNRV